MLVNNTELYKFTSENVLSVFSCRKIFANGSRCLKCQCSQTYDRQNYAESLPLAWQLKRRHQWWHRSWRCSELPQYVGHGKVLDDGEEAAPRDLRRLHEGEAVGRVELAQVLPLVGDDAVGAEHRPNVARCAHAVEPLDERREHCHQCFRKCGRRSRYG